MSLRGRLQAQTETVHDFEVAAEQRYWDAMELLVAGRGTAGIYLIGYVGDMLLKSAYFRFEGAGPATQVGQHLGPAKMLGKGLGGPDPESYHSLRFWAFLLRERRRFRNVPLPAALDAPLIQRVRRLYQNWWVDMRYRADQPHPREIRSAYDDVTWVRQHYVQLWR
jgi:hypothetical protein